MAEIFVADEPVAFTGETDMEALYTVGNPLDVLSFIERAILGIQSS